MHPIFIQNFIHHNDLVASNTIFFLGFNGESLEDPLVLSFKCPSTPPPWAYALAYFENDPMWALPPHLRFLPTYLPTYLPT
jgi:hypothetical protein